jgi:hypothetical protein
MREANKTLCLDELILYKILAIYFDSKYFLLYQN